MHSKHHFPSRSSGDLDLLLFTLSRLQSPESLLCLTSYRTMSFRILPQRKPAKGDSSPPSECPTFFHCYISVSESSIKLTGEPVFLFWRQKSQLDLCCGLPPTLAPNGSRPRYWVPWRLQKRNSDSCIPYSWNIRGTDLRNMPLCSKI